MCTWTHFEGEDFWNSEVACWRSELQFRGKLEYFVVLMKGLWQHALLTLGQICVVSDRENCLTVSLVYCLPT